MSANTPNSSPDPSSDPSPDFNAALNPKAADGKQSSLSWLLLPNLMLISLFLVLMALSSAAALSLIEKLVIASMYLLWIPGFFVLVAWLTNLLIKSKLSLIKAASLGYAASVFVMIFLIGHSS